MKLSDEFMEEFKDFLNSKPNPNMPLIRALHNRLGHHTKEYYFTTDILKYLKVSKATYNSLVSKEFGILDKVHFRMASAILIHVESSLSLEIRLFEELLYILENPKQ